MATCSKCGATLEEGTMFCTACGAKVEAVKADTQTNANNTQQKVTDAANNVIAKLTNTPDHTAKYAANDVSENKIYAILSYIAFLFIVPLLAAPESKYSAFHANQGLILFILEVVSGLLGMIPYVGWFVLGPVCGICCLILLVIGILNAVQGKAKELPFVGGIRILKD